MPKHEISNVRTRGTGAIEKLIFYKTEVSEHQEIRVRAEFEGDPEPEQIKRDKKKGDSEESPNEKERVDEFVNEWCRLYRETSQASHDNHEESR